MLQVETGRFEASGCQVHASHKKQKLKSAEKVKDDYCEPILYCT